MPRFFTENIDQNSGSITGEDAKHIARVLRMKNGQPLTVCDTKGYDYACIIEGITEEQIDMKVLSRSPSVTEPNVSVHLYQAMPKADKLELIIQKAVELGVNSITPVMTVAVFPTGCQIHEEEARALQPHLRWRLQSRAAEGLSAGKPLLSWTRRSDRCSRADVPSFFMKTPPLRQDSCCNRQQGKLPSSSERREALMRTRSSGQRMPDAASSRWENASCAVKRRRWQLCPSSCMKQEIWNSTRNGRDHR